MDIIKQECILKNSICSNKTKGMPISNGVYFLIENNKIVYVGRSKNVRTRISCHKAAKEKFFNRVYCFEIINLNISCEIESFYIEKFRPFYNFTLHKNGACNPRMSQDEINAIEVINPQIIKE